MKADTFVKVLAVLQDVKQEAIGMPKEADLSRFLDRDWHDAELRKIAALIVLKLAA